MEILILPAALGLIVLLWFMGTYNGLIRLRNHCRESWADIDTELKRRHDLIPNVVAVVKRYAAHEQHLFEEVTAARARANTGACRAVPCPRDAQLAASAVRLHC